MTFIELIFYSLTQGITEFLPISSSAHLLLIEKILHWNISGRTMAISAHLGSLIAVIFYLRKEIYIININKNFNFKFIINLTIITLPILLVGLIIFKNLDNTLLTINIVAYASIIGGLLLFIFDRFDENKKKTINNISYIEALILGLFQIFALIPGASRAGTIITAARLLKLNRIESAKLSLYSGIPTISGAVILESIWLISEFKNIEIVSILIIIIFSALFAYITINLMLKWLNNKSYSPFIIYRIILGLIILIFIKN